MKRRYDLLYAFGALVSSPVLAVGLLRTGKWRTDWRGRFGKTAPLPDDPRPTLLLHGVSVGEINATRELVARLTAPDAPPLRLVISATTNTGFARAQLLYGDRMPVVRFPFDFSWMVTRFFDAIRPDALALMELELWPNLVQVSQARGIPLAVINGRLSGSSYGHYRWGRLFFRSMFRALAAVGAQTEVYARRFEALGTPRGRITVTDTMKWDTVRLVDQVEGAGALGKALGIDPALPLVVAGSTGPGEEELLLAGKPDGVQLLLVPRKPERFEEVARLVPGIVRRSERPDGFAPGGAGSGSPTDPGRESQDAGSHSEIFLLDTMGELTKAFALADVAVVGRSFVPMGGSDPIEPIALGKATVMGPHHENFLDVVDAFSESGGIRISDAPMEAVRELLDDPEARREMGERGREVIRRRQGATEKNVGILHRLLKEKENGGFPPVRPKGRVRRWLTLALILYMAAGYLSTIFHRVPAQGGLPTTTPLPTLEGALLSGVFSVHTDRSHDARGTRGDVAAAAAAAGLDFVVIGDHPPDDRKPGWAFWDPVVLGGVFIEGGQELRSPEAGKILAVGVDTTYKRWEGDYLSFTEMLAREEATAFVVHGRGPRDSERWVNPDAQGVQGWEVLDISEFAGHRIRGPWGLYHLLTLVGGTPFGLGDEALLHLMREGFETPTVAAYDSLRNAGPLTATAGLNVHPKVDVGPFLIPGYGSFFRTFVSHVGLTGAPPEDPVRISAALMNGVRSGNVFISAGGAEAARGFRVGVVDGSGRKVAGMGGEAPFRTGLLLRAGFETAPDRKILYRVVKDGVALALVLGPDLEMSIPGPGLYRVEVYSYSARLGGSFLRLRPWIFGNPVGLT